MGPDVLTHYAWIVWLSLILLFIVIEVFTLDFTFLMLAVGSFGGLLSGLVNAPWWVQVIVAGILAVLLLFAVRPPLLKALRKGSDPALSNVAALIGCGGTVVSDFDDDDGAGQVRLDNGETWTARLPSTATDRTLESGDRIFVLTIDGATAVVEPVGRNTP